MENLRFAKLLASMGQPKEVSNKGLDDKILKSQELQRHLQAIDDKIAQLEESDDPNALESINFWRQRRSQIAGD